MLLVLVDGPDALLERQKGFVDFGPVHPGLLVLVGDVGGTLTACQVDEGHFAVDLVVFLEVDLEDGVGPRRVQVLAVGTFLIEKIEIIGKVWECSKTCDSDRHPEINELHERVDVHDSFLLQAHDVNVLLGVLPGVKLLPFIQKVVQLPAVNLIEGDPD